VVANKENVAKVSYFMGVSREGQEEALALPLGRPKVYVFLLF